ncbi:MAG: CD1871A family CXXC motif-containing protein [Anaerovoracaceae bacterium]
MKIKITVLFLALVLVGVGIYIGQHQEVMNKAIRVCLECIGVG